MKTILKLLLALFATTSCISCEQIENGDNDMNKDKDFYYVRFEAHNKPLNNSNMSVNMSLSGCNSIKREGKGSSIIETLGPAEKNAQASISASGNAVRLVYIYVSKNNGPFALQAEGSTNASCILDF